MILLTLGFVSCVSRFAFTGAVVVAGAALSSVSTIEGAMILDFQGQIKNDRLLRLGRRLEQVIMAIGENVNWVKYVESGRSRIDTIYCKERV